MKQFCVQADAVMPSMCKTYGEYTGWAIKREPKLLDCLYL